MDTIIFSFSFIAFGWLAFVLYNTRGRKCPYCSNDLRQDCYYCEICDVEWDSDEVDE